jgi:aminopeptidase YwaD
VKHVASSATALVALLAISGCSGTSEPGESERDRESDRSSASCVLAVAVEGERWVGWPMSGPLTRPTTAPEVPGTIPDCDDLRIEGASEEPRAGRPVTLTAIEGISPEDALFLPGQDLDDQVFVPDEGPGMNLASLPDEVQALIRGESSPPSADQPVRPGDLDPTTAVRVVRHLAGTIGPREATGRAYARAARWVQGELEGMGYDVARQRFDVPTGESWGVPVPAGRSVNVVATPVGFDRARPHLVIGAHLDTVPQAPGAEDNASGVGVLLAVAEAVAQRRTRLPVVLVAFGAEEPRGPGDDDHHYGSRHYAAELGRRERTAVRAMVSLDRVGVGATVPVGSATSSDPVQRSLLVAARSAGVRTLAVAEQRSSDHWSFVRAGLPAARLGSTSYAAYHSAADVPAVVQPDQLARVGRVVLAWLAPRQASAD